MYAPASRGVEPFARATSTIAVALAASRKVFTLSWIVAIVVESRPEHSIFRIELSARAAQRFLATCTFSLSTAISTRSGVAGASRRGQIL